MISDRYKLPLTDADVWYWPDYYHHATALDLFNRLQHDIAWRSDRITLFGKTHSIPRLHAFYGDDGLTYSYSGIHAKTLPWSPLLNQLRQRLAEEYEPFNFLLANYYRDGRDSNGWHADDEKTLGPQPLIASLSFGCERDFQFKHRATGERVDIALAPGSLLIMAGETQANWLHCIPKRLRCQQPRINLTFRQVVRAA